MNPGYQKYLNRWGMVSDKNGTTGNDPMYSGENQMLPPDRQWLSPEQVNNLRIAMASCEKERGRFFRLPDYSGFGHETHDNLYAVGATLPGAAGRILNRIDDYYGFYFTTPNPNEFPSFEWFNFWGQIWMKRFPQLRAHLKICDGRELIEWEEHWWKTIVLQEEKDHGNWRVGLFMCHSAWQKGLFQEECQEFGSRLAKAYPHGGVGQLWGEYFIDNKHPNAEAAWGWFPFTKGAQ